MKLAVCHLPLDASNTWLNSVALLDTFWTQFGDKVLLYTDETQWEGLPNQLEQSVLQIQEQRAVAKREHVHLVVQKGRLFQQEHPDVSIIFDRGRFLLVELEPDQAYQLNKEDTPCYVIRPLEENQVVFDVRKPTATRAEPTAWVQSLVDQVSRSSFEADLTHLVSYPTRFSTSTHYADAAGWMRGQLEAMNYITQLQSITVNGSNSLNIIADKLGSGSGTRDVLLLVAHLDSINQQGGPMAIAPGADDNGSGSAGLLQIARALKDLGNEHDLRFALFGGEEQGLFGSKQYVDSLPSLERRRIRAVINMDMIGSLNSTSPSVLLEGSPLSQGVIDQLNEIAATYTQLTVQTSLSPYASDHVSFIDAGIPAVLTIEGADSANSNIHSSNDIIDHINYDLALEILRMNVAFVAIAVGKVL